MAGITQRCSIGPEPLLPRLGPVPVLTGHLADLQAEMAPSACCRSGKSQGIYPLSHGASGRPLEWAPWLGQDGFQQLTGQPGFQRMQAHGKTPNPQHRIQTTGLPGVETLHGLSKRHDISRNLIRIWVEKYQAGALDGDAAAADLLQTYEARIAALERLVGRQALELEFLKGALHAQQRQRSEPGSAITDPTASPLRKDVG